MKVSAVICLALIGYASGANQCQNPLDVVLVVEDSNFLPAGVDSQVQGFLSKIVTYLKIGSQFAPPDPFDQVAYVQYGSAANSVFHLNSLKQTSDASSAVLQTPFKRDTNPPLIENGLRHAWDTELTVTNGERSCYGTVVILFSYSSYADPNHLGADPTKAAQGPKDLTAARQLTNSGALVITVGVGKNRDAKHLRELATNPTFAFDYIDFNNLTDAEAVNVATAACGFVPTGVFYPGEMPTVKADFAFVVDTSSSFTTPYSAAIIDFIQTFLTPFTYDHVDGVQAALVTYSKTADVAVKFGDADNLDDFIKKATAAFAAAIPCQTDSRCIDQALNKVNYEVFVPPYYRQYDTVHYVFVFTAGCFNCDDPISLATLIKSGKNAEIFVVPLGPALTPFPFAFWKEPLEIATDYSHLFEAQADPASILKNYLPKQAWRNVFVSQKNVVPPPSTTAAAITTTTAADTTTTTTAKTLNAHHRRAI